MAVWNSALSTQEIVGVFDNGNEIHLKDILGPYWIQIWNRDKNDM